MKEYWDQLAPRERLMVVLAGVVVLFAALYVMAWEPFQGRLATARKNVAEGRVDLAWMEQAAVEVRRLQGAAVGETVHKGGESLIALVDRSARGAGLGSALKRVEPEGKDKVRVWLDEVAFDKLLAWLAALEKASAVAPESLVVDRQATPGRVNARLVLMEAGS